MVLAHFLKRPGFCLQQTSRLSKNEKRQNFERFHEKTFKSVQQEPVWTFFKFFMKFSSNPSRHIFWFWIAETDIQSAMLKGYWCSINHWLYNFDNNDKIVLHTTKKTWKCLKWITELKKMKSKKPENVRTFKVAENDLQSAMLINNRYSVVHLLTSINVRMRPHPKINGFRLPHENRIWIIWKNDMQQNF